MNEDETRALAAKLDEAANADWPGGSPQRIARLQLILNEALGVKTQGEPALSPKLPRWRCHKIVKADRIGRVAPVHGGGRIVERWHLDCGLVIEVDGGLLKRSTDPNGAAGGYYVRYTDGYASWSPAKAFEEGYTRLNDDADTREAET